MNIKNNIHKRRSYLVPSKVKVVNILKSVFSEKLHADISKDVEWIFKLEKTRGSRYIIQYLKKVEEILFLRDLSFVDGIRIGVRKNGSIKRFRSGLQSKIKRGDTESIRYARSLIKLKDIFTSKSYTNLESITGDFTGDAKAFSFVNRNVKRKSFKILEASQLVPEDPDYKMQKLAKQTKYLQSYGKEGRWPPYYKSRKAGPNGESLLTRIEDSVAVIQSGLIPDIQRFLDAYTLKGMDNHVETIIEPFRTATEDLKNHVISAKLNCLQESGKLKPRVVAIIDGVTQEILKPFHDLIMRKLRLIEDDCTFNQNKVSDRAKQWHKEGKTFYGFADLSSASDRIPKEVYEIIGNRIIKGVGTAWLKLFDRDFVLSDTARSYLSRETVHIKAVTYKVGQPMGALSSWPMMTVVHHTLVWCAAGRPFAAKGKYLILGDDIVIADKKLYRNYKSLMRKLGVVITSNTSPNEFEFAKRHFRNGLEVTGVPMKGLLKTWSQPIIFASEWSNLKTKGYNTLGFIPTRLIDLMRIKRSELTKINNLLSVPGTTDPELNIARWVLNIQGRSACHLTDFNLKDAVKPFRQASSLMLSDMASRKFNQLADETLSMKNTFENMLNKRYAQKPYGPMIMTNHSSLLGENVLALESAYWVYIRALEADYKDMYSSNDTNLHDLIRPRVKDWLHPVELNRSVDSQLRVIRERGKFIIGVTKLLN
jgi:hypothetical protein